MSSVTSAAPMARGGEGGGKDALLALSARRDSLSAMRLALAFALASAAACSRLEWEVGGGDGVGLGPCLGRNLLNGRVGVRGRGSRYGYG